MKGGREGVWEGKEVGAKTGNFAKVAKFSHLCCCSRKQEDECNQGDREVERARKKKNRKSERTQKKKNCHSLASSPEGLEMSKQDYT